MKIKKIHQGFHGDGNKYQYGEVIFIVSKMRSFIVFDQAIGINSGQEIFRIYGRVDFNYGMAKFKEWLSTSKYNQP